MNNQSVFTVEIWSDVVCPFCYLGKRKFEDALERFEFKEGVRIIWKSFQLNPGAKTDPTMSVYSYLSRTKGISEEVAKQMTAQIMQRGKEVGINYNFDSTKVNNTFMAHCFLHYALEKGKQNEAKEHLLKAYFEQGANVDDVDLILQIGCELGFDAKELKDNLENGKYEREVKDDMELAVQFGIRGVPFFVFDRKYAVSGAQESPVFLETLEKAYEEWKITHGQAVLKVKDGDSCQTDEGSCV